MIAFDNILEFKSSPALKQKLLEHSILKRYVAGDVILSENMHIGSIPIVSKGSIRVIQTEKDGREILLYYIKAVEICIMSFLGGMHDAVVATSYSLFIIGLTSAVGLVSYFKNGLVHLKTAVVFGVPSIVSVFITRAYLVPAIPKKTLTLGHFVLFSFQSFATLRGLIIPVLGGFLAGFGARYAEVAHRVMRLWGCLIYKRRLWLRLSVL